MDSESMDEVYRKQLIKNKTAYDQSLMDIEKNFKDTVRDITKQQSRILAYAIVGLVVATVCINALVFVFTILAVMGA